MDLEGMGRALLVIGVGVAVLGGLLMLISRIPGLNQLFNLPGDIQIQSGNLSCFFPVVSMILISVVLTILANIFIRLINRP
jgi:hypothetical protein